VWSVWCSSQPNRPERLVRSLAFEERAALVSGRRVRADGARRLGPALRSLPRTLHGLLARIQEFLVGLGALALQALHVPNYGS